MSDDIPPQIAAVAAIMDEIDQCRNPIPCHLCRQRMQSILDMGAATERERSTASLESLARDVVAFAPASDGWAIWRQAAAAVYAERQRILSEATRLKRSSTGRVNDYVSLADLQALLDPAEPVGADAQPGELGSIHHDDQASP